MMQSTQALAQVRYSYSPMHMPELYVIKEPGCADWAVVDPQGFIVYCHWEEPAGPLCAKRTTLNVPIKTVRWFARMDGGDGGDEE